MTKTEEMDAGRKEMIETALREYENGRKGSFRKMKSEDFIEEMKSW
jgi:hypothetical protein